MHPSSKRKTCRSVLSYRDPKEHAGGDGWYTCWTKPPVHTLLRDAANEGDGTRIDLMAERLETEQEPAGLLDYSIDFGRGGLFRAPRVGREA